MYKFNPYWTDGMKISFLQRTILIHSYLYYEKDNSIWSDKQFDEVSKQLVKLMDKWNREWIEKNTQYGYVFYDFDGTTGFDLWGRLKDSDKEMIAKLAKIPERK